MPRRLVAVLVAAAAGAAALAVPVAAKPPAADAWVARPATYGVAVTRDVPITMVDGTVLPADVYRPALGDGTPAPGRFPVLLVQTPYNKAAVPVASPYLVQRGYVDVVVDVRGSGASEGTFTQTYSAQEQQDGRELVAWAAAQPWSTGAVGLHGTSYYAINQLLTAAQQPPALKAIFPVVPAGDSYRSFFPGGYVTSLFVFSILYPALGLLPPGFSFADPVAAAGVLATRPAGMWLNAANALGILLGGDHAYDGQFSHATSPLRQIDRIKVPTFLVGGWFDALSHRDAPLLFKALQDRKVPVKLLMGPWHHTNPGSGLAAAGLPSLDELQLRWFDRYVAGRRDPGLRDLGPVITHRLGEGAWRSAPTWPPPTPSYTELFLGGPARPGLPGTLSAGGPPPAGQAPDHLAWHPASGACTRSTMIGTFGLAPTGPCADDDRANGLTGLAFDLPVEDGLSFEGPLSARLYVSSSARDAHLTLRVEDVAPDGRATQLTAGWDTLSFRALDPDRSEYAGDLVVRPYHPYTRESVQPVVPGEVYEWWVEVWPVSARIAAGHRLRLSVEPADAVRFLPTVPRATANAGGVVDIHHDAAYPSALVIPVAG